MTRCGRFPVVPLCPLITKDGEADWRMQGIWNTEADSTSKRQPKPRLKASHRAWYLNPDGKQVRLASAEEGRYVPTEGYCGVVAGRLPPRQHRPRLTPTAPFRCRGNHKRLARRGRRANWACGVRLRCGGNERVRLVPSPPRSQSYRGRSAEPLRQPDRPNGSHRILHLVRKAAGIGGHDPGHFSVLNPVDRVQRLAPFGP